MMRPGGLLGGLQAFERTGLQMFQRIGDVKLGVHVDALQYAACAKDRSLEENGSRTTPE